MSTSAGVVTCFRSVSHHLLELGDAMLAQHKLHPRFHFVLAISVLAENAGNRFNRGDQFLGRQELGQQGRLGGKRTQPAANQNLEAKSRGTVRSAHLRNQPYIMNPGHGAVTIVLATRECNFEFTRQIAEIRMPQQKSGQAQCVRSNVERLATANSRQWARGDRPHRIEASFPAWSFRPPPVLGTWPAQSLI